MDSCNWAFFAWEENAALLRIEKPNNISNYEFIEILYNVALQTDSVISYELMENRGEYTDVKFYTMDEREDDQSNSVLYNISVYDFYKIEPYHLGACAYYVKSPEIALFYDKLERNGIYYQVLDEDVQIKKYFRWNNIIVPAMMLLVSFLFLAAAYRKTFTIKRIMGYGIFNIVCDFFLSVFFRISVITMIELCLIYMAYCFL